MHRIDLSDPDIVPCRAQIYIVDEMNRLASEHRETYRTPVISPNEHVTQYNFVTESRRISRYLTRMSLDGQYYLAILLETAFRENAGEEIQLCAHRHEKPVLVVRTMIQKKVVFTLSVAR